VDSVQGPEGIQDSIPNTHKERLHFASNQEVSILKRGMPFNLTSEDEPEIVNCILIEIQSIGLELKTTNLRQYVLLHYKEEWARKIPQ
jgi:hypothetical protein